MTNISLLSKINVSKLALNYFRVHIIAQHLLRSSSKNVIAHFGQQANRGGGIIAPYTTTTSIKRVLPRNKLLSVHPLLIIIFNNLLY